MKSQFCRPARRLTACWIGAALLASAAAPPVPKKFQPIYTQLDQYLKKFNATLDSSQVSAAAIPTTYSAAVPSADGNVGPLALTQGYYNGTQLQLLSLKAMGVQGVMVEVGFPMLYVPFLNSQGQNYYQDFVNFYKLVARNIRQLGMKVIVENDTLLPSSDCCGGWNTTPFYKTLDWTQYQKARAQTARTVAETMQPDYLVVFEEPESEANNTGQPNANTVAGATTLVKELISSARQAGVPGMQVGAGTDTFVSQFENFIQAFVGLPLDFIDMHIYQVNYNDLPNALTIASTASKAGLPVTMSESWLHKISDNEIGQLNHDQIRARDPFSFWAPLDTYFAATMENLARYTQMSFMTLFESHYLWAYLPYDKATENLDPNQILTLEVSHVNDNLKAAVYTSTGMSYYHSLVTPPDTVPPTAPETLTGRSRNPTTATINWTPSTDNVGVAGYHVFRNGTPVATTARTTYHDAHLQSSQTYTYTVRAFDLAGNVSPSSPAVQVTTQ
jgi:hypothetical protein